MVGTAVLAVILLTVNTVVVTRTQKSTRISGNLKIARNSGGNSAITTQIVAKCSTNGYASEIYAHMKKVLQANVQGRIIVLKDMRHTQGQKSPTT